MYNTMCFYNLLVPTGSPEDAQQISHYSDANFIHSCVLVLVTSQENGQYTVMPCIWHFGQRWITYTMVP